MARRKHRYDSNAWHSGVRSKTGRTHRTAAEYGWRRRERGVSGKAKSTGAEYPRWKNNPRKGLPSHLLSRMVRKYGKGGMARAWSAYRRGVHYDDNKMVRVSSYYKPSIHRKVRGFSYDRYWENPRHRRMYRYSSNPAAGALDVAQEIFDLDLWTGTVLPMGAGFVGSRLIANAGLGLINQPYEGIAKHAANILASGIAGGITTLIASKDMASKVLAGGLVNEVLEIIKDLLGGTIKASGSPALTSAFGLGEVSAVTEEMKKKISEGIKKAYGMKGTGFLTEEQVRRIPVSSGQGFLTQEQLRTSVVSSPIEYRPVVSM